MHSQTSPAYARRLLLRRTNWARYRILGWASQFRNGTSQCGKNDGQRNLGKGLLPDLGRSLSRIFLREVGNDLAYRDCFIWEQVRALHRAMSRFHLDPSARKKRARRFKNRGFVRTSHDVNLRQGRPVEKAANKGKHSLELGVG
jgi:hypothetical protein